MYGKKSTSFSCSLKEYRLRTPCAAAASALSGSWGPHDDPAAKTLFAIFGRSACDPKGYACCWSVIEVKIYFFIHIKKQANLLLLHLQSFLEGTSSVKMV
jgi:hypothetical protein